MAYVNYLYYLHNVSVKLKLILEKVISIKKHFEVELNNSEVCNAVNRNKEQRVVCRSEERSIMSI